MTLAYNLSQLANNVNSSGQLDASTGLINTSNLSFPTGTLMLFQQTAAPTGWTKQTTHNNKALRVVSGTASSGGSMSFTSCFTSYERACTLATLSWEQMPQHNHYGDYIAAGGFFGNGMFNGGSDAGTIDRYPAPGVSNAGSNAPHGHNGPLMDLQYVDLIIAAKS